MKRILDGSPFPITLQCGYGAGESRQSFERILAEVAELGFFGIELNLPNLQEQNYDYIPSLIRSYGLKLTYLATGEYAQKYDYSLSSADSDVRRASINGCKINIDYAATAGCGIIIGFLKGGPDDRPDLRRQYLVRSLTEISQYAFAHHVPVLLEATNRYESAIVNCLRDAVELAVETGGFIQVLPDTFHMNIEEKNPFEALRQNIGCIPDIHFSDNNRFFPGYGFIDFIAYTKLLLELGYHGTVGIEGNIKYNTERDVREAALYLNEIFNNCRLINKK